MSAPPAIEEIAPHFPELEILELLGYGAMGAVYKARQPQLERMVAIKILSHELSHDPAFVERFNREAKMLARLSHPNIVAIHDFGTAGPYCYLRMELVDGVNLRQAMETGGFKPGEALRDIKPENVLIDAKGRAKIADFGIAKMIGIDTPNNFTLTLQGSILGTPHYMAPEQIETPGDVDQRADIYSLGVVLYEMLTGELPIGRFDLPSQKTAMDARIDEIVLRTLAKERKARFQSAGEVGTHVASITANPQAPGAIPTGDGSGMARFSILSAILTGVSIPLIFVFFMVWTMPLQAPESAEQLAESASFKLIPTVLLTTVGFFAAVGGLILGAVGIGDVRKSGGRKSGLGLAMFAALAWPSIITVVLHLNFRIASSPMDGPAPLVMIIYTILHFVTLLLAGFFMTRGLWRWAAGVETKDGQRRFPQIWGTLGLVVALLCFGPVLGSIMSSAHSFGGESSAASQLSVEPKWSLPEPQSSIMFDLPPGRRADLTLKIYEGKSVRLGSVITEEGFRYQIKLGTIGHRHDASKSEQGIAVWIVPTNFGGSISGLGDIDKWEFKPFDNLDIISKGFGKTSVYVAEHPEHGSLYLDIDIRRP